jgi:hypothetical protein
MSYKLEEHLLSGLIGAVVGAPTALLLWLGLGFVFGLDFAWAGLFFGVIVVVALVAPTHFGEAFAAILRYILKIFPA